MDSISQPITRKQFLIICLLVSVTHFSEMVYSLQGPLYPREAQSKNATATEFGLVLGVYGLASVVFSPLAGFLIPVFGLAWAVAITSASVGISTIIFGLLDKVTSKTMFIGLGCLCRIVEAAGFIGLFVTANSFIATKFTSSRRAVILGIMDSSANTAWALGPFIGSVLFQWGGYGLPFEVVGGIIIITGLLSFLVLRNMPLSKAPDKTSSKRTIIDLIKLVPISVQLGTVFIAAMNIGFIVSLLEIHLRHFFLTPIQEGLVFLLYGAMCGICSPLFCYLAARASKIADFITYAGAVFAAVAFLLMGPVSFLPLQPSLGLTVLSVFLLGIGISMTLTTGLILMLTEVTIAGYEKDDAQISVQLTSLWTTSLTLGGFVSPIISGALCDEYGFIQATNFPLAWNLVIVRVLYYSDFMAAVFILEEFPLQTFTSARRARLPNQVIQVRN